MNPLLRTGALTLVATLLGCGSAPTTHFHGLMPPAAAGAGAVALAPAPRWELLPVTVPVRVEQPQWVIRMPDGTLALLENERWIAPLADEIQAALAERLRQLAPAVGGTAHWRIAVDVLRFESVPGTDALIEAEWTLRSGADGAVRLRCRRSFEQPAGTDYPALAAAHRAALMHLGDAIAASMLTLDKGAPAGCA